MKNFFPLKILVILYSFIFLVPLFFILQLPNSTITIIMKILLGFWMTLIYFCAAAMYPHINLGAFLCCIGLVFSLRWVFYKFPVDYLLSLLFILFYGYKFGQINKIKEESHGPIADPSWCYVFFLAIWVAISMLIAPSVKGIIFIVTSGVVLFLGQGIFSMIIGIVICGFIKDNNVKYVITLIMAMVLTLLSLFLLTLYIDRKLLVSFELFAGAWIIGIIEKWMLNPVDLNKV